MKWIALHVPCGIIINWPCISSNLRLRQKARFLRHILGVLVSIWQEVAWLVSFEKHPLVFRASRLHISRVFPSNDIEAIIDLSRHEIATSYALEIPCDLRVYRTNQFLWYIFIEMHNSEILPPFCKVIRQACKLCFLLPCLISREVYPYPSGKFLDSDIFIRPILHSKPAIKASRCFRCISIRREAICGKVIKIWLCFWKLLISRESKRIPKPCHRSALHLWIKNRSTVNNVSHLTSQQRSRSADVNAWKDRLKRWITDSGCCNSM